MTTRLALFIGAAIGASGLALAVPGLAREDPPAKTTHGAQAQHGQHHDAHEQIVRPAPAIAYRGCAAFDEADYGGRRTDVRADVAIEWLGAAGDNRISAVACASGCRLLGYEHINFGGARRSFSGGTADVGEAWNDRISAVRVICAGDAPLTHQGH